MCIMQITENVRKILSIANNLAAGADIEPMPIHLLYGCAAVEKSLASKYLRTLGITVESISSVKMVHKPDLTVPTIIKESDRVSSEFGHNEIVSEAVLLVLCTECLQTVEVLEKFGRGNCLKLSKMIVEGAGIDPATFVEIKPKQPSSSEGVFTPFGFQINDTVKPEKAESDSKIPEALLRMGADLTAKARAGKIDTVIGREEEITRVTEILSRKTKNNPVLIGEAGVGKSAIIEGLALRIVAGNVPTSLKDKTIFSLDIGSLMAGTKYRGELEQKLENLIKFVTENENVILFIDEIHTITTAGGKEGELGIAEILKPKLARGEMQTIGATTTEEYRKYIEKDAALERRFAPIMVNPPTVEQAIEILAGLRGTYEQFHGVSISQDALTAAVNLTDRYITDRNLPDKAIDALDEACSKAKIKSQVEAAKSGSSESAKPVIGAEGIAEVISIVTKIPITSLTNDEKSNLINLEEELKKSIIGQDKAISYIAKAVRRSRSGVGDSTRPIGSFMFLGKTGVGKTEVCKVLAKQLFLTDTALIKLDMSEFQEGHSVSKLVGSPPGYVGYDDASVVCERVRRNPYSIVLFDEIEKAHPDVYNVLLQILDEGRLTDNKGKTTSFRNAMIIMTSNVGVENLSKTAKIGFAGEEEMSAREEEAMMAGLKKRFKPEFINRIDNVVVFNSLTQDDVAKIAKIQIDKLVTRLKKAGITLSVSKPAIKWIAEKGYSHEYGARPLRRVIQSEIEDKIAEELISKEGATSISVDVEADKLVYSVVGT